MITLNSRRYSDAEAAVAAIEAAGGHAVHVLSPRAIIARVPAASEGRIRAIHRIASMRRDAVPVDAWAADPDLVGAVSAWNHLHAIRLLTTPPGGSPLIGDALVPPSPDPGTARIGFAAAPTTVQTSEFMVGRIAVGVILPESDGGTENWSPERQTQVFNAIVAGMNWWATKGGATANLTFYYDQRFGVPTQYEPINRSGWSDESIWVGDIFANMGYTSGDAFTRGRAYVNSLRNTFHTDWCFAIIVADSLNDPDGKFADGQYFAWAWLGGPYSVMCYDNDGYGISRMHEVIRHETGHTFLAGDEYCDPGYACCDFGYYGYLGVYNGNCENGNPASVPCVMRRIQDAVCPYTSDQIGWRDSDGDGKPDTIDNVVSNTLNAYPSPTVQRRLTFTGSAVDVPYDSPTRADVTINRISSVLYRVDGGDWIPASASDGAFDEDSEPYTFTTDTLAVGPHAIETIAYSTSGNVSVIALRNVEIVTGPAVVTSVDVLTVPERGTAAFGVKLSGAPQGTVIVTTARISGDPDISVQSGASLQFKAANWDVWQTVTLAAAHDSDRLNGQATIRCSAPGHVGKDVVATESDDEVPADFDSDGDVDLADFTFFQGCFSGPNELPQAPDCEMADLDHDEDIDLADLLIYQRCFNGPNNPPLCPPG